MKSSHVGVQNLEPLRENYQKGIKEGKEIICVGVQDFEPYGRIIKGIKEGKGIIWVGVQDFEPLRANS